MEPFFEGGHSIVASFVEGATGELFVASRESGDVLKVGPASGDDEKPGYDVRRSRQPITANMRVAASLQCNSATGATVAGLRWMVTDIFAAQVYVNTGGVPNGVAFDANGVVYICDFAHQAVLTLSAEEEGQEQQLTAIVKDYEGKGLKGPNSVVVDGKGTVFFTDSGPFGAPCPAPDVVSLVRALTLRARNPGGTTLASPKGSVFCISPDGRLLQPLALQCLAHPSGLAVSPDEQALYVCETMANRVLRFVQKPAGVFHFSVFYQFSGGLGPTGVACDAAGNLYVGRMDFSPSTSASGSVAVLSSSGALLQETLCPGSEISGIVVAGETVYISEASTNTVYTMPVVKSE